MTYKYTVVVSGGQTGYGHQFESNSRNSKLHVRNTGADCAEVYLKNGKLVSKAIRVAEGRGKIINVLG